MNLHFSDLQIMQIIGRLEYPFVTLEMFDPKLHVKADSMYDCMLNTFCTAKLSMSLGFTKGVSVDV